jgi:hypothetical protein
LADEQDEYQQLRRRGICGISDSAKARLKAMDVQLIDLDQKSSILMPVPPSNP